MTPQASEELELTAWSVTLGTQGFAIAPDGTLVTEELWFAPTTPAEEPK